MSGNLHKQLLSAREEVQVRARIEQNPRAVQPRARLAVHCWRSGALPEAVKWIDSCLVLDPANVNFYRVRANVFADMKHSAKAVKTAMKAIKIAPESVMARLLTVRMLLADLQPARAQKVLDSTLALDPDHQQLRQMKSLQAQILNMTRQSEHDPINWLSRKLEKRLSNVAGEDQDTP